MTRIHLVGALASIVLTFSPAIGQQDFSEVQIKTTRVAGRIYMLEGRGGNLGVSVGGDGVVLIDDQYAPLAQRILSAIEKLGGERPKFILNTHWHGDHTGGNEFFGESGTIIAHTNVRKRLSTTQVLFARKRPPLPSVALPVITFDGSLSIHFNGEEIRMIHFPHGHTDGDGAVFFTKSNVVHMGDLMFMGMFPFVDLEHGGSVEGLIRGVQRVIDQVKPDVKVIPGHGPLTDYDGLRTYHRMLLETTDLVRAAIGEGKGVGEVRRLQLPEEWRSWDSGFIKSDRWLETIYQSLTGE